MSELTVEGFIGSVLPRLAGLDECSIDILFGEPSDDRLGDELWSVIRSKYLGRAMNADDLREYFDDVGGPDSACHVDLQALSGVFIDHRQTFGCCPLAQASNMKSYA